MARTKLSGKEKFSSPEAKAAIERRKILNILRQPRSLVDNRPSIIRDSDSDSEPDLDFIDELDDVGFSIRMMAQFVPHYDKAIIAYRLWQIRKVFKESQERQEREHAEKKKRLRELSKWERKEKRLQRLDGRIVPARDFKENDK